MIQDSSDIQTADIQTALPSSAAQRPSADPRRMRRGPEWVTALCGLSAIIFLVVFWRDAGGMWRDEVNSVNMATLPSLAAMWHHLSNESFPLLWLLVERCWISAVGGTDSSLRVLGLLIGLALIAAIWLCGRWCGYVPLVALALIADNPVILRTAALNRAYGLGYLLIVLVYHGIWKLTEQPTRRRAWAVGLLALLATQTLYYNIVFILAMLIGAAVILRPEHRKVLLSFTAIAAVCLVSLLPYVFGPIHQERQWSFTIHAHMDADSFSNILQQSLHLSSRVQPVTGGTVAASLCWAGLFALCLYSLELFFPNPDTKNIWTDNARLARMVSVALLLSLLGYLKVLKFVGYDIATYHLSILVLMFAMAGGHLLSRLRSRVLSHWVLPTLALLVVGLNVGQTLTQVETRQTNADVVAQAAGMLVKPGDFVLVSPYWLGQPFARYYHGQAPWATSPPLTQYLIGGEPDVLHQMYYPAANMDHRLEIESTLKSGHTVWLASDRSSGMLSNEINQLPPMLPPYPLTTQPNMRYFYERLNLRDAYLLQQGEHESWTPLPSRYPVNTEENMQLVRIDGWKSRASSPEDQHH